MKIVIDLPEKMYHMIMAGFYDYGDMNLIIQNGTPLPKGHGRLIDADALKKYIDDCDCCVGCEDESFGCSYKCKCPDYLDKDMERIINNQPTILEADKAESEDSE